MMNAQSAYRTYVETSISVADPLELTRLLYRGAIEAILRARQSMAQNDVRLRASHIGKAQQILAELVSALDAQSGLEIAGQLNRLYDYILHLLQTANFEQREAPLAEAQQLLQTLLDAWDRVEAPRLAAAPNASAA